MIRAGMNVARFELGHDNKEEVRKRIMNLKYVLDSHRYNGTHLDTPLQCKIMVDITDPQVSVLNELNNTAKYLISCGLRSIDYVAVPVEHASDVVKMK